PWPKGSTTHCSQSSAPSAPTAPSFLTLLRPPPLLILPTVPSLLAAIPPIVPTIIPFILTVVAVTSKDWAHQNTYDGQNVPRSQWTTPLYTLYRSPFWTCSPVTSSSTNATSASTTYTITCVRFGPKGGSCVGLVGTGINDTDARY